jgi:hypothetical protein
MESQPGGAGPDDRRRSCTSTPPERLGAFSTPAAAAQPDGSAASTRGPATVPPGQPPLRVNCPPPCRPSPPRRTAELVGRQRAAGGGALAGLESRPGPPRSSRGDANRAATRRRFMKHRRSRCSMAGAARRVGVEAAVAGNPEVEAGVAPPPNPRRRRRRRRAHGGDAEPTASPVFVTRRRRRSAARPRLAAGANRRGVRG